MEQNLKTYSLLLALGEMFLFFPFLLVSTITLTIGALLFHIGTTIITFLLIGTYFKENDDVFVFIVDETWANVFKSLYRIRNRLNI